MTHTLETLLLLLDSPKGLERLRILTAEADGKSTECYFFNIERGNGWEPWRHGPRLEAATRNHRELQEEGMSVQPIETYHSTDHLPDYTTSLDAIFAAEERLGLHDDNNHEMQVAWYHIVDAVNHTMTGCFLETNNVAFIPVTYRNIAFILTEQSIRS